MNNTIMTQQKTEQQQRDCYRITVWMGESRHTCFAFGDYEQVEEIAQSIGARLNSNDWEIALQTPVSRPLQEVA